MRDVPARIQPIRRRRTFWSSRGGRGVRAAITLTLWAAGFAIIGNGVVHLYGVVVDPSGQSAPAGRSRAIAPTVDRSSFTVFPAVVTPTYRDKLVVPALPTELTPISDAPSVRPAPASTALQAVTSTAMTQVEQSPTAEPRQSKVPPVRLRIDGIGVDAKIVLVRGETLLQQPVAGWYFGTAYPGDAGNVVLLGHLNGDGEIFGDLEQLRPGDSIQIDTANGTVTYVVEGTQLADRRAIELLGATEEPTLTLITCAGDWRDEIDGYDMRLVVQARLAS